MTLFPPRERCVDRSITLVLMLVAITTVTAAPGLAKPMVSLRLDALPPGNLFLTNESIRLTGSTPASNITWRAADLWGATMAAGTLVPSGKRFALEPDLHIPGYYTLSLRAAGSTAEVVRPVAVVAPYAPVAGGGNRFGAQTHFAQNWPTDLAAVLARTGLLNIRDELYWGAVERKTNVFEFPPAFDGYMKALDKAEIQPMICLTFGNKLHVADGGIHNVPHTPEQMEAFGRYAQEVLKHYGTQLRAVEVWNEYNGSFCSGPAQGRPECYAALLRAAYKAIKRERPDVKVLGCATVHVPLEWIAAVLEANVAAEGTPCMDAVSVHPYRDDADGVADDLLELRRVIREHNRGRDLPVWVTEQGWSLTRMDDAAPVTSRIMQACYLARSWLEQSAAGVEKSFWYVSRDCAAFKTMGLFGDVNDGAGRYAAHPAAVAYATLIRELEGARFISRNGAAAPFRHIRFERGGRFLDAVWAAVPCAVDVEADQAVVLTDLGGTSRTVNPTRGHIPLWVSDAPVYLYGANGNLVPSPVLSVDLAKTIGRGESVPMGLRWPAGQFGNGELEVEAGGVSRKVAAGATMAAFTIPAASAGGDRWIPFRVAAGGATVAWGLARAQEVDPVRIGDEWCFTAPDRLRVPVENLHIQGVVRLDSVVVKTGETVVARSAPGCDLQPGARQAVEIAVPAMPVWKTIPCEVVVTLGTGEVLSARRYTGYHPVSRRTITVDGQLDEWADVPGIDLSSARYWKISEELAGKDDLSGWVRLAYDATNLYFAACIRDNIHSQTYSGWSAWKGDSLQIGISPLAPWVSRQQGARRNELSLALTEHGPELYRAFGEGQKGVLDHVAVKIRRMEAETLYEAAIPWFQLPGLGPDAGPFSFGLYVNDNDGTGRRGFIQWGNVKDRSTMQPLVEVGAAGGAVR